MMTLQQVQKSAVLDQKKATDVAKGLGIAILSSHVPFALSYVIARLNGFTAFNYPAVEPIAAAAGLAITLLSLPIAIDMHKRSIKAIAISSAVVFWILGLLTAFTV